MKILIPSLLACMVASCATTLPDAYRGFLKSTDVTASVSYDGVSVSDTITNGRRHVGVNVDAKQIARLQKK